MKFYAVMIDETGCEFPAEVDAVDQDDAYDQLSENYPESSVDQLETLEDIRRRECDTYFRVMKEMDY
jgi:hypothetical protein